MPPLKGIDRGLDGDALRALETSGHGRRLAIVDASYDIPRWAEVVDYHGLSSANALLGIVRLIPVEGELEFMSPDPPETICAALKIFNGVARMLEREGHLPTDEKGEATVLERHRLDEQEEVLTQGFYSIVNDREADTLFVRTRDGLPYACATFVIGHSQGEYLLDPIPPSA